MEEIADWARWVALAAILIGTAVTRDYHFALSCGIGAAVDIRLMRLLAGRTRAAEASGQPRGVAEAFGVRLLLKGVLLLAAFLLPSVLDLWGMLVGVVVVELTLMTVGAAVAAARLMRGGDTAVRG
jgi:small-conductance mechanosensitive channel